MIDVDLKPRPLASRICELRPVYAADTEWLYTLLVHTQGSRWRYRGHTPSPATFAADLWHGVHAQYVACDVDQRPRGIVGLYNANHVASHCHLFAVGEPDHAAVVAEGAGLLVDWAFAEFDFDKLWIESPEFNLEQFSGLRRVAEVEGRLRNHDFWKGRFWDLYILSIERTRWRDEMQELVTSRSRPLTGDATRTIDRVRIETLIGEVWPLDSLGRVELMAEIEDAVDRPVDLRILDGLDASGPAEAADLVVERMALLFDTAGAAG